MANIFATSARANSGLVAVKVGLGPVAGDAIPYNGLLYDTLGNIYGAAPPAVGVVYANGLPIDEDGRLIVDDLKTVSHIADGVPFTDDPAVAMVFPGLFSHFDQGVAFSTDKIRATTNV